MIVGVTGTNGAGKGTLVEAFKAHGFRHYSVRDLLVEEILRRGLSVDRATMGALGDEFRRRNEPGYFIDYFVRRAKADGAERVVIESVRSVGEVSRLKELGGVLVSVDADRKKRFERIRARGSHTDKGDFATWVKEEEREWHADTEHGMNIPAVMALADYRLTNNGNEADFRRAADALAVRLTR